MHHGDGSAGRKIELARVEAQSGSGRILVGCEDARLAGRSDGGNGVRVRRESVVPGFATTADECNGHEQ
jgi:hypothetical protein